MSIATLSITEDGATSGEMRQLLRQGLETVLARHGSFDQRREAHHTPVGHSAAAWSAYAELGLLAMGLPEAHGGLPGSLADVAMAAELLGGALALEPYRATMVAARLLAAAGTAAQQAAWLPSLAAGTRKAALAHAERAVALDEPIAAEATRSGSGWRLNGRKSVVPGGDVADMFLLSARAEGGIGLFLISAAAVERRAYGCFDWTGGADLLLADTFVPEEAKLEGAGEALALALDETTALACADAVGAIRAANALTRDHARTRRQFGLPIGGFQVLQHRMADMAVAEEMAAAITEAAVSACMQVDAVARSRAVSAAKVKVGEAARHVGQQCVQIHGGMGLTEEYPAAHYFARLGLFEQMFGSRDEHVRRFMKLG